MSSKTNKKEFSSDCLDSFTDAKKELDKRRASNSSDIIDSESSTPSENMNKLKTKSIENIKRTKPRDFNELIDKRLQFNAFDMLNMKTNDYICERRNGIHKLMCAWETLHGNRILPSIDLKQIILILLHKEKEIIEDTIEFKYAEDIEEVCCGCFILSSTNESEYYKKIDRIYIKDNNKTYNFYTAYKDVYDYIKNILMISLDYTIEIPK